MNKSLEELLEESVRRISQRISTAEEEFLRIAGERLRQIGILTAEEAREYLFSMDAGQDQLSDFAKIKKVLLEAHNANLKELARIYRKMLGIVSSDTEGFIVPSKSDKKIDPLLMGLVSFYMVMAQSTNVNETYKSAVNGLASKMAGDTNRINFASAMRKTIQDLTETGISTFDEKGRKTRMESAVYNGLRKEYTGIVQNLEIKAGGNITTGWEISVHFAPAKDHEEVQGKIFTHEEFNKLQDHETAVDIDGGVHQLDRAIGDWNCQHYARPFIIGESEPRYTNEELEELKRLNQEGVEFNGEHYSLYEADQLHWRYEREIQKERQKEVLLQKVKSTDPALQQEYKKSRERLGTLSRISNELGELYDPIRFVEMGFEAGHSVGAMAERFYVKTPKDTDIFEWHVKEGTSVVGVKVMAEGTDIDDIKRLVREYKLQNGTLTKEKDWYKVRGTGIITNGQGEEKVELHWYQCKNIGKVEFKVKRYYKK